jgi:hypothetical protein
LKKQTVKKHFKNLIVKVNLKKNGQIFLETEMMELNDFRKLILHKVLRPDSYIVKLNDYVNQSLELSIKEPSFRFVFENPLFKSIIINMGSQSNISNTSSMSRIHKNLYQILNKNNQKFVALNCNFLTLTELRVEIKNIEEGFILLKNVHLASQDIIESIKYFCDSLHGKKLLIPFFYLNLIEVKKN